MSENQKKLPKHPWKVAIAGELMAMLPFSMYKEPEFLEIKKKLDAADFCYGHLETNFGDFNKVVPARAVTGGSHLLADPELAKEYKWLGIDIVSLAHNHAGDWGGALAVQTRDVCREAGIPGAGVGQDLYESREPCYMQIEQGRVSLVSSSSGNPGQEWANLNLGSMPTRPGINPQRMKMRYLLPENVYETFREAGKALKVLREDKETGEFNFNRPIPQDFRACVFAKGDDYGIDSACHKGDLEGNMFAIQEARKMSDFVMSAQHCQPSEGVRGELPTQFVIEYAHASIDNGADMYLGHGWHKMLGIEIYKGKPIFYGLGDFFYQSQFIRRVPLDGYEGFGHDISDHTKLRPHLEPLHSNSGTEVRADRADWWMSCLIEANYDEEGNVKTMDFYPLELGVDFSDPANPQITRTVGDLIEGRPYLAKGATARFILETLARRSEPFGTKITIDGDVGHWEA